MLSTEAQEAEQPRKITIPEETLILYLLVSSSQLRPVQDAQLLEVQQQRPFPDRKSSIQDQGRRGLTDVI